MAKSVSTNPVPSVEEEQSVHVDGDEEEQLSQYSREWNQEDGTSMLPHCSGKRRVSHVLEPANSVAQARSYFKLPTTLWVCNVDCH